MKIFDFYYSLGNNWYMKIILNKKALNINPETFLRRAGYAFIQDRQSGNASFVRRLGNNFYPRLHLYFEEKDDRIIFNLHLDQKKPSYQGARAHNAEYEGEVVENEIERLKNLLRVVKSPPPFQGGARGGY